jgi:hypothetical protein
MKIAYLISAHTDAPQLARLIGALHKDAEFFVHIDKKSDIRHFKELISARNVHFIEKRTDIRWATFRQVEYQMALLKAAIEHPTHFDRIFTLSGLDYPLWSNERITQWLTEQGEREILQGYDMNTNLLNAQQRNLYTQYRPMISLFGNYIDSKLSIILRKMLTMLDIRRKLSLNVKGKEWDLYKGSSWWCISEDLARYVVETYNRHPEIRRYFLNSFGPDECMIQTIAFNSEEWKQRCILTTGEYPGLHVLTPLHYIVYEPVIQVMQEKDLHDMMASGRMFARKFLSGQSEKVINEIEKTRN